MARCPKCHRHFRVLEDEEGMHDCPHCGFGPDDDRDDSDTDDAEAEHENREMEE